MKFTTGEAICLWSTICVVAVLMTAFVARVLV